LNPYVCARDELSERNISLPLGIFMSGTKELLYYFGITVLLEGPRPAGLCTGFIRRCASWGLVRGARLHRLRISAEAGTLNYLEL